MVLGLIPQMVGSLREATAAICVLDDDKRNRIYEVVSREGRPLTRDEVADAVRISRKLAAFHLDKLVERGLLVSGYEKRPAPAGPRAGRSSKVYERSDVEIEISLPQRRYDIIGRMFVSALQRDQDAKQRHALTQTLLEEVAFDTGVELGERVRREARIRGLGPRGALRVSEEVVAGIGFEPYANGESEIFLRNCPFESLSQAAPDVVCSMNRSFVDGVLRGIGDRVVEARLEPLPRRCCVSLRIPDARARSTRG